MFAMKPFGYTIATPHLLITRKKMGVKGLDMVPFQRRFRTVLLY
jgi:hypothetical protein